MHQAIWQTLRAFWRDCALWPRPAKSVHEQRQIEQSIREHGTLWLVDQRYSDMIPAPVPSQRRRKATR